MDSIPNAWSQDWRLCNHLDRIAATLKVVESSNFFLSFPAFLQILNLKNAPKCGQLYLQEIKSIKNFNLTHLKRLFPLITYFHLARLAGCPPECPARMSCQVVGQLKLVQIRSLRTRGWVCISQSQLNLSISSVYLGVQ